MLKIGTPAPTFTAKSTDNREVRLSDLKGKHVVLFFFPKAFTTGCTIESKQFRDVYPVIQRLNGEVIGISKDKHETQCDFASSLGTGYPMIGDEDGRISKMYDVVRPILGMDKRVTYVLDDQGIIQGVFSHELLVGKHVENVLDCLQKLERDRGRGPKAGATDTPSSGEECFRRSPSQMACGVDELARGDVSSDLLWCCIHGLRRFFGLAERNSRRSFHTMFQASSSFAV